MPTDHPAPDQTSDDARLVTIRDPNMDGRPYPRTVDEYLHLLSCFWADQLPADGVNDEHTFGRWERQARPVIESLVAQHDRIAALTAEVERLRANLNTAVRDQCDDDTAIRDIAKSVLPAADVDGDSC